MRHTRMRQITKVNKDPKDQVGTDTIESMTRVHSLGLNPKLDKSFKWHREYNNVSFTINLYGDTPITLYADLYKEDSVYF